MQRGEAEIPQFQSHWKHLRPHRGSILFTWKRASVALKGKLSWGWDKSSTFMPSGLSTEFSRLQTFNLLWSLNIFKSWSDRNMFSSPGSEMCASSVGSFQWGNVCSPQVKGQPLRVTRTWTRVSERSNFLGGGVGGGGQWQKSCKGGTALGPTVS